MGAIWRACYTIDNVEFGLAFSRWVVYVAIPISNPLTGLDWIYGKDE
jgi:hypothetical protein